MVSGTFYHAGWSIVNGKTEPCLHSMKLLKLDSYKSRVSFSWKNFSTFSNHSYTDNQDYYIANGWTVSKEMALGSIEKKDTWEELCLKCNLTIKSIRPSMWSVYYEGEELYEALNYTGLVITCNAFLKGFERGGTC